MSYTKVANVAINKQLKNIVTVDWGFKIIISNEIEALQIAYGYRNNAYGVKIEVHHDGKFCVTVFNEFAKKAGIDTGR